MTPEDEPPGQASDAFSSWGEAAGGTDVAAAAPAPAEPGSAGRRRRRRRILLVDAVAGLAVGVLVIVLAVGGGGGGGGDGLAAQAVLLRAADVSSAAAGFRIALTGDVSLAGQSLTIAVDGSIDPRTRTGSLTLTEPGLALTERLVGNLVYMQLPAAAALTLGASTPWVSADASAALNAEGFSSSLGGTSDPSSELGFLRVAGQVTDDGSAVIRGDATTHYSAVVDLNRVAAATPAASRAAMAQNARTLERYTGSSSLPLQVYVDGQGRPRRLSYGVSFCTKAGNATVTVSADFYDYGPQPVVSPPPAGEVTDVSQKLLAAAASQAQQIGC
jgi:hypothetical protein